MEVRLARPEEYAQAGEVTAAAYREFVPSADDGSDADGWLAYLDEIADVSSRAERAEIWVAVGEDGAISGSLTLELAQRANAADDRPLPPDEAHIRMLGVAPTARGSGAGRALMIRAIERAREAGKSSLTLNSTPPMTVAQYLYVSLGFERQPDQVFPDGFRLLSYELPL